MQLRLADAAEFFNLEEQIELYMKLRDDVREQLNRMRNLGFSETSNEIIDLEQQYRAFAARIVEVFNDKFQQERESLDRHFSNIEFNLSVTTDDRAADRERMLNDQLENRLQLSQKLVNQMTALRISTDEVTQSSQSFRDVMQDLERQYQDVVRGIFQLVEAHKNLASAQISDVRNLQNQIISMLRARHQRERDLEMEAHDARRRRLDEHRDNIRAHYQAQIDYIDDLLRALQRQWAEEDRNRRQQNEINDLEEIRRRINELKIAAASGDAEA